MSTGAPPSSLPIPLVEPEHDDGDDKSNEARSEGCDTMALAVGAYVALATEPVGMGGILVDGGVGTHCVQWALIGRVF